MILAASLTVLRAANGGWLAWVVAFGSTAILMSTKISPFILLAVGAALFLLLNE